MAVRHLVLTLALMNWAGLTFAQWGDGSGLDGWNGGWDNGWNNGNGWQRFHESHPGPLPAAAPEAAPQEAAPQAAAPTRLQATPTTTPSPILNSQPTPPAAPQAAPEVAPAAPKAAPEVAPAAPQAAPEVTHAAPSAGPSASGCTPASTGTASQGTPSSSSLFGKNYTGDGTYYGAQSPTGRGACSLSDANTYPLPWSTGVNYPVAMDSPLWDSSMPCGMCLAFHGTGAGSGATPIPSTTLYALVSDECPECKTGSLDIAAIGDGRWTIDWYPVQCAVGSSAFHYSFQGSNSNYLKMQISNTRVPVASVTMNGKAMTKSNDNYWLLTSGGPFNMPQPVTVTSVLGDTVKDEVPSMDISSNSALGIGSAQFPASSTYGTVGAAGGAGSSATPNGCRSPAATTAAPAASPAAATAVTPPPPTKLLSFLNQAGRRLQSGRNRGRQIK